MNRSLASRQQIPRAFLIESYIKETFWDMTSNLSQGVHVVSGHCSSQTEKKSLKSYLYLVKIIGRLSQCEADNKSVWQL